MNCLMAAATTVRKRQKYVLWNIRVRPGVMSLGMCAVFYVRSLLASFFCVCVPRCKSLDRSREREGAGRPITASDAAINARVNSRPALSQVLSRGGGSTVCLCTGEVPRQGYVFHSFYLRRGYFPQFWRGIDGLFSLNSLARSEGLPPWDMHILMHYLVK